MSKFDFDLFVIGAGSGGVRAARIAAGYGARVGICESSRVGGTCVIRGCVPKKLLSYAAHFHEEFEDAAGYGWDVGKSSFSWSRLIANKDREIDRLNQVYLNLLDNAGVKLFNGHGKLIDSHRVQVGEDIITADKILIATGGRPWVLDIPGAELGITSDEAFHLESLPGRVIVVGGGFIACEFAGIFNGLGSKVVQAYRGEQILRGFDHDVQNTLAAEMKKKGIDIRLHINAIELTRHADGHIICKFDDDSELEADVVMFATGRVPNVRGLGLRDAGVEVLPGGMIPVNEYSRTNLENVFAVGDVTNRVNLTPVALMEGHAFADSEFGDDPRPVNHGFIPSAVFSHPPVATVGFAEKDAEVHYGELDVYRSVFKPMKHTLSGRDEKTMMKLLVQKSSGKVVGLHVVGMDAPEIVQGFAVAIKSGLTKRQFDQTTGIHPTAAEELVTMRVPVQG
ncbi:MAG: glutathione-disulfide reductase [Xanthomonadales bacterium]|nr:glutathione-disulfide reductase [Gammaproteobacteria bacterium]MBT8074451.1 glutathione-disulfide reductase [Gammaproteobacteria bacterium]NNK05305.1 glutathione-disulfide reductase [Xanthomonadales bacterium]